MNDWKTTIVPSQFPDQTTPYKVAWIGEAPSDEEVQSLRPFVGPAGRIFNGALRAAGIERSQHFVGNVFSRPLEGPPESWMKDKAIYLPEFLRLAGELLEAGVNCIVPMGGTAQWAFTGVNRVKEFRGAVQVATRILPGAKLLPTYHPSAILHGQWKLLTIMVGDFVKAEAEARKGPNIVYPKVRLLIDPSIEEVESYCDSNCTQTDLLSIDIETGWGQITMVGLAPFASECLVVPFLDFRKTNHSYWPNVEHEVRAWKAIKRACESPAPKLLQNGPYDAFWLWEEKGIATMNYGEDTRLKHHAMFPELEKGLAFMAARYTDVGAYKHWGGSYSKEKRDDN